MAGFSLTELLMVLAIISLTTTFAISGISSMFRADQYDQSLTTISGLMDRAREAAVADNRYVWVAFTDNPPASAPANSVAVAIFESQDGTDALNNFTNGTGGSPLAVSTANNLRIVMPPQHLGGIAIMNAGTVTLANAPSVTAASMPGSMDLTLNTGASAYTFTPAWWSSRRTARRIWPRARGIIGLNSTCSPPRPPHRQTRRWYASPPLPDK